MTDITKVLIVEDEAMLRAEVVDWLRFEGYEVFSAEDGETGVEDAIAQQPDLIVCDITLPRRNGYDVLLAIRANPATTAIPFIFVTARAAHDDIRQGMALGADDYVTKPFTRLELLQTIRTRLEKKQAQDQKRQVEIDQMQNSLRYEREQHLLMAKMIGMFMHDFRNPLASIMSANWILRNYAQRISDENRLTQMARIESSVRQLMQMLDDMLIMAQIETGNLDPQMAPLPIAQFLQEMVDEFQAVSGSAYRLVFESQFSGIVMADARLLRQIVANLLSNAIKYSPSDSDIRVTLDRHEGNCVLSVKDCGVGIPEADQARLFSAFQRGSNVGKIAGTGLGLAIVKHAVDLQGGSIQLESQVGAGTTVTVTVPCVIESA